MRKKIVVVGSAGNLGKYIYKELNKTDILIGIQRKKEQNNFECKDLSNSKMSSETFSLIKKKHSSLDAIIICTGKSSKSSLKNSDQKFLESFKSNLLTVSNTIEAYQKVYKNKPTKIIVISSIAAIKVLKAPIEYSVTKSALNHYCQIKAKELAKFSINLNIISPGNILNKDNNWFIKKKNNPVKIKNYIKKNVPLNSFCNPKQILMLCKLLINQNGKFFQGSNIVMDGGQSL